MPRADDIDFDPADVGVEPADLDPEPVHGSEPAGGFDVLEADPVDVAEQRREVPVDDPDDLG